ncbi:MAG: hypothetical protein IKI97_03490 [Clostridia bacterium]|nr:hypothetical protein [Clostridia bacterium]
MAYNNKKKEIKVTSCDLCQYYIYDDETDSYFCSINLDEDEMVRFLSSSNYACPYFVMYDEYKIVRKQN